MGKVVLALTLVFGVFFVWLAWRPMGATPTYLLLTPTPAIATPTGGPTNTPVPTPTVTHTPTPTPTGTLTPSPTPTLTPTPTATPAPYDPVTALAWNGFWRSDMGVTTYVYNARTRVEEWITQEGGNTWGTCKSPPQSSTPEYVASVFTTKSALLFEGGLCISPAIHTASTGYAIAYVNSGKSGACQSQLGYIISRTNTGSTTYWGLLMYCVSGNTEYPGYERVTSSVISNLSRWGSNILGSSHIVEWWNDGSQHVAVDGVDKTATYVYGSAEDKWWSAVSGTKTVLGNNAGTASYGWRGYLGILGVIEGSVPSGAERTALRTWITGTWDS